MITITAKLKIVLTPEELNRLNVREIPESGTCIIADVHGMKCYEARRFINNIINLVRSAFQLVIIHGYNHGTAIKDMFARNFSNSHITNRYLDPHNQGVTHMLIT